MSGVSLKSIEKQGIIAMGKIQITFVGILVLGGIAGLLWYLLVFIPNEKLDKQLCQDARLERSLSAWQKYLESFPDGKCTRDAKEMLALSESYGNWIFEFMKKSEDVQVEVPFLYSKYLALDLRNHNLWTRYSHYTKPSYGKNSFGYANSFCEEYSKAGFSKWRVPTLDELDTLKVGKRNGCKANSTVFPRICKKKKIIWSSDFRQLSYRKDHYSVNFRNGTETSKTWHFSEAMCLSRFPSGLQTSSVVKSGDNWVQLGKHAWEIVPPKPSRSYGYTYNEAVSYCNSLNTDGLHWRLPKMSEAQNESYNRRTQSMDSKLRGPNNKDDWYWASVETNYQHYRFVDPTWGRGFNFRTADSAGRRGSYGNNIDLALVRCIADLD